ncbi:receptor-type tyrosine-protein phosphatase N2-like [Aplochiton taeniatus]
MSWENTEWLQTLGGWQMPQNINELRIFLGLASYYRRFTEDFASLASPLHQLSHKGQRNTRVGAILSQESEQGEEAYFRRSFTKTERNYCVTRRELLAVVLGIRHFCPYLYGRQFLLRTDHASLTWLLSFMEPEGQLARQIEALQEYDFEEERERGNPKAAATRLSLVSMDYFTKWPEVCVVPDQSGITTATKLNKEMFSRFGMQEELHRDQGCNLESQVFGEICRRLGVKKTRSTPLHPQSDGLVEQFNRTLATQLAILVNQYQKDWNCRLPLILMANRTAVQESTQCTPSCLMFGREMRQRRAYDTRCQGQDFGVGDRVWVYQPTRKKGVSPNLACHWVGPCMVLAKLTDVVYRAQHGNSEASAKLANQKKGTNINQIPTKYSQTESTKFLILTVISILCIVGVLLVSTVVYCLRNHSHHKLKEKLTNLGTEVGSDATATYQELCRQRMAVKPPVERPEPLHSSRIDSVSSQFSEDAGPVVSPTASSWFEEPAHYNLDISTGHMILSYMEDHLKNKDRLEKEWEAMCAYQAEPNATTIAKKDGNGKKNRSNAIVAYDHSRIHLKVDNSQGNSDYINASPIMDHDPRNPAYISTQGPLPSTVADFWQMVWENGCVVIVMLTPLTESGVKQCYHYWPDEGSNLYHIYEVNLVSEHIWCDDFLVRSFYLKNMQTNETRTVTQFHFLTWLNQSVPEFSRTLLDFRRKVNKCYRGRSCPIIVHCSDGSGRSGTYILIDMVLNKMAKGAKEIDIAATLEHLRDQRPGMVQTKEQFEFALTAVAEEVNAIIKALPQ